jgi:hypothetical protein
MVTDCFYALDTQADSGSGSGSGGGSVDGGAAGGNGGGDIKAELLAGADPLWQLPLLDDVDKLLLGRSSIMVLYFPATVVHTFEFACKLEPRWREYAPHISSV